MGVNTVLVGMATTKTATVATRVPTEVKGWVEDQARKLGKSPGTFLRDLLVRAYNNDKAKHVV